MKAKFYIDTCSLIALGYSGLLERVMNDLDLYITPDVKRELIEISKFKDDDSRIAQMVLQIVNHLEMVDSGSSGDAEVELIRLSEDENSFLVTDDLKALKGLNKRINYFHSVHLLYIIMKKGKISKYETRIGFNKMRIARDWQNNHISLLAQSLLLKD